jgi:hypothetical protein
MVTTSSGTCSPRKRGVDRLIDVEVHPVDAFDFQSHVLLEDYGDRTW